MAIGRITNIHQPYMETTQTPVLTSVLTVGLIAFLIGAGIGYSLGITRIGFPSGGMHMMSNGAVMRDGAMNHDMDQQFIIEMIPHHQGAITMAQIALERTQREEIRALAKDIITAQTKEIQDMTAWYQSWYGSTPPQTGGMMMHMDSMSGNDDKLRTVSDTEFDREFMQQMIPHHEMAIMMARMIRASEQPEMRLLAEAISTSQAREIESMRTWLAEWY